MSDQISLNQTDPTLLRTTAEIVAAFVSRNQIPTGNLRDVITTVYAALANTGAAQPETQPEPLRPAVPIRKSVAADYIICLEDGKKLKMLKRHLRSTYNLSPD